MHTLIYHHNNGTRYLKVNHDYPVCGVAVYDNHGVIDRCTANYQRTICRRLKRLNYIPLWTAVKENALLYIYNQPDAAVPRESLKHIDS